MSRNVNVQRQRRIVQNHFSLISVFHLPLLIILCIYFIDLNNILIISSPHHPYSIVFISVISFSFHQFCAPSPSGSFLPSTITNIILIFFNEVKMCLLPPLMSWLFPLNAVQSRHMTPNIYTSRDFSAAIIHWNVCEK